MKKNYFTKALFAMGAVVMLASCSHNTDLYDENAINEQKKAEELAKLEQTKLDYAANFVKKYGEIDPNQTWDFTTGLSLGTRGLFEDMFSYIYGVLKDNSNRSGIKTELVDGLNFGTITKVNTGTQQNPKWDLQVTNNTGILNTIKSVLPDGQKLTNVKPVTFLAPTSDFYIYPVSVQGMWTHDLMVRVGNQSAITVYSKEWTDFSVPYVNGMTYTTTKTVPTYYYPFYKTVEETHTISMPGIHIQAPVGTPIDVYVGNVYEGNSKKPSAGTFNGRATYVDAGNATIDPGFELKQNAVVKYIGIEDNTGSTSDGDHNDIVLAVVGNPDVPSEAIITNDEYDIDTYISKRYLVEDLGASDDFDFNDLVVDVYQYFTEHHKRTFSDGELVKDELVSQTDGKQEAIIRAMGGTREFTVKIGDTEWSKGGAGFTTTKMYNTEAGYNEKEELAKFDVSGWNPLENNISITVTAPSSGVVYTIPFAKQGDVPMIVAVNATSKWNWMTERQDVPEWWYNANLPRPEGYEED